MDPYKKNEALMATIVNSSIKQLSNRYELISIGKGMSEKDNKSKMESVSFELHRKLTMDEARILIVEIVELFLHNINGTKEITSFLYDNPFTYKNLELRVFIFDKNRSDVYHPDLGLVSLTPRGTVSFVTYEEGTASTRTSYKEEPYEEAYKIATRSVAPKA